MYTLMQITKFPRAHLVAGGWYLDCSRGFVSKPKEPLYIILVSYAPKVIELEEEPEEDKIPTPPTIVKEVGSAKGEGWFYGKNPNHVCVVGGRMLEVGLVIPSQTIFVPQTEY